MSIYTVFQMTQAVQTLLFRDPNCSFIISEFITKVLLPAIWEWNDLTGKIAAFIYEHLVEHLEDQRRH